MQPACDARIPHSTRRHSIHFQALMEHLKRPASCGLPLLLGPCLDVISIEFAAKRKRHPVHGFEMFHNHTKEFCGQYLDWTWQSGIGLLMQRAELAGWRQPLKLAPTFVESVRPNYSGPASSQKGRLKAVFLTAQKPARLSRCGNCSLSAAVELLRKSPITVLCVEKTRWYLADWLFDMLMTVSRPRTLTNGRYVTARFTIQAETAAQVAHPFIWPGVHHTDGSLRT